MNPTSRAEVEALSNTKLNDLAATVVMGWHVSSDQFWYSENGNPTSFAKWPRRPAWANCDLSFFSPTTNLKDAWMLVEKVKDTNYVWAFHLRVPSISIWAMSAQEAARAITIAALCAKLGL